MSCPFPLLAWPCLPACPPYLRTTTVLPACMSLQENNPPASHQPALCRCGRACRGRCWTWMTALRQSKMVARVRVALLPLPRPGRSRAGGGWRPASRRYGRAVWCSPGGSARRLRYLGHAHHLLFSSRVAADAPLLACLVLSYPGGCGGMLDAV